VCSHRWNESVATEVEGVSQFGGTPISASTNRGFRSTFGEVVDPPVSVVSSRGPGSRQAASVSVVPCVPVVLGFPPDAFVSPAVGVGQHSAAPLSFGSVDLSPDRNPLPSPSVAVGVGQEPEPFALVRGTNGGRGQQSPFRSPPVFGKVGEDVRQPVSNKLGDVLQEQEPRSHVTNALPDGRPEPPVIVNTAPLACARERLAGEPGRDEIHASTPRSTVEGAQVRPDRRRIQVRLFHPGHESGRCVGVPLNVHHGSGGDASESEGELDASVAGAEVGGM